MTDLEKYRHLNQDNWKRTQVRMPQETYDEVSSFAKEKKLSLNSALITLVEEMLSQFKQENAVKNKYPDFRIRIPPDLKEQILQVNFRMPAELKEKLENAAKESGRSITSELVIRLEQSFNHDNDIALPDFVKQGLVDIINTQLANAQKEIESKLKVLQNLDEKDVEEFIAYQLNKKPTA